MKIGVISDIHEDSRSLETAIRILEKKNCDELVCLGDIVGFDVLYYRYLSKRDAARCVALIRDHCRYVVAGNHDFFAARRIPASNGMFPFPKDWYELDFRERERLGKGKVWLFEHQELSSLLNRKEKDFLESLPEHIVVEFDQKRILFSHSIYPDLTGTLVWRPGNFWDFREHFRFLESHRCRLGFSGHLHPNGIGKAIAHDFSFLPFRTYHIRQDLVQYISPCTANSASKNGIAVLDLESMTVEGIPLKSRKYQIGCFQ
jgi:predicted phosphodiesterase